MDFVDSFLLLVIAVSLFYYYATYTFDYWRKRGVPFIKPYPLFGSSFTTLLSLKPPNEEQKRVYDEYKGEKYVGRYLLRSPALYVLDPDLIHKFLIEDFNHFRNRGINIDEKLDPLAQHLVNLRDQKWKSLRNKLTPVFSSGKLKTMHHQLVECSNSLKEYLEPKIGSEGGFEAREVMAGLTTDVIGSCAFGIKMNALKDPNSEFRRMGRRVFRPSLLGRLRLVLRSVFPKLLSALKWKALPKEMEDFFVGVIKESMISREVNNIEVPDFLQLLINLKKEDDRRLQEEGNANIKSEVVFDEMLLAANAFVFFLAGFETTASTLSYCLYELSENQDIQNKARDEVQSVLKKYDGVPNFEAVKEMTYLDQIISETLRKYPPVITLPRELSDDYRIEETGLVLEKGMMIQIPIYSLHHDPDHYPEPQKFNPDRFSKENIHKIKKGTYLPFGDGPRICIGMRFARLEMRVVLATLLRDFKFSTNPRTLSPLQYNPKSVFLVPVGGLFLSEPIYASYLH